MIDAEELKWLGETPRIAAYRVGANGHSAAQIGLAAALVRGRGNASNARTVAPAMPQASTSKPRDRVKVVADAVANDPGCKGKAAIAIKMLADPDCANVSGSGIVKMIKSGASADAPTPQGAPHKTSAFAKASAPARASAPAPKAASTALWDKAISSMGKPPKLAASKASMDPWDNVIGRMKSPAY